MSLQRNTVYRLALKTVVIEINAPPDNHEDYFNRKQHYSVTVFQAGGTGTCSTFFATEEIICGILWASNALGMKEELSISILAGSTLSSIL